MKDIITNQVWEDKEGYHWLIVGPSTEDGFKCKCTYIPKKKHLVGRYKIGQILHWEYDGKESDIFYRMIKDEYGNPIQQKEVEKVKLSKPKNKHNYESEEEGYISDVYEPDSDDNQDGDEEVEQDESFTKKVKDQRALSSADLDEELEKILVHINSLGDENTEHKIDFNPFTKARLEKKEFIKLADKALHILKDINLGKRISRSMLLTTDDLADINKSSRIEEKKNDQEITSGQIWERQYKGNKSHGERIKVIHIKNEVVYTIRILTPDGNVPTYSMCQTMSDSMLKNYYFLTDQVSRVTMKEIGQFPMLQTEFNSMRAESLEGINTTNFEDLPVVKRLNSNYSDTVKALQALIKIRFKILSDI